MKTGDLATIDDEGYCNIVGRIKDMVIRGGENVYPREIEEFLYRHPKIQDVQVIGVPDPRYGEELCAWVKLRDGETRRARGDPGLLPGPDRPLQNPALHQIRRRLPDDRHRQDPEIPDARGNHPRIGLASRRRLSCCNAFPAKAGPRSASDGMTSDPGFAGAISQGASWRPHDQDRLRRHLPRLGAARSRCGPRMSARPRGTRS